MPITSSIGQGGRPDGPPPGKSKKSQKQFTVFFFMCYNHSRKITRSKEDVNGGQEDWKVNAGPYAFLDCVELRKINLPSSLKDMAGCGEIFKNTRLSSIEIPEGVKDVGQGTFAGCAHLLSVKLPSSMTRLRRKLFEGCGQLKDIVLPPRVTHIEEGAFKNCASLESIEIPEGVTVLGCFKSDRNGIVEPSLVVLSEGLETIEHDAFAGCQSLKEIVFPEGLKTICDNAFDGTGLVSVTVPQSVESIGSLAFARCRNLTTALLPAGVEATKISQFYGCDKLVEISRY